ERVRVSEDGLRRGERVADGRLRRPVLRPGPSTEERGQGDGDQDADDQNDHHQFDEGETLLAVLQLACDLAHHVMYSPPPQPMVCSRTLIRRAPWRS